LHNALKVEFVEFMNICLWDSNNWQLHNAIPINQQYLGDSTNWHGFSVQSLNVRLNHIVVSTVMQPQNLYKYIIFYHKILWRKKILWPPCPKIGGTCLPRSSVPDPPVKTRHMIRTLITVTLPVEV